MISFLDSNAGEHQQIALSGYLIKSWQIRK